MNAYISLSTHNRVFPTFFPPENIALAHSLGTAVFYDGTDPLTPSAVAAHIGSADTYVTAWGSPALTREVLDSAPQLRLLVHLCGTVVPFVTDEMWERGIRVISGNEFFAESVAEGVIGYVLSALREIPGYSTRLKEHGIWKASDDYNRSLIGKTVGIVSYGTIARHLVRMLAPFRVRIKVYDIAPLPEADVVQYGLEAVSLEELFSTCDIVSLHTPLYDKTYHLIGEELLRLLPDGALFVNTSRGAIVDQQALERRLSSGRFRAVLDVYETEPLPKESPLRTFENVLLMPHMAGPTVDLRKEITRALLLEASEFLKSEGPLPHEITRKKAETMSRS